ASVAQAGIENVLVNLHHHAELVRSFLAQPRYRGVVLSHEPVLLGTGGTLRHNRAWLGEGPALVVHADNLCGADLGELVRFHNERRPSGTAMTMMTFRTPTPQTCGIVECDARGVVQRFAEKVADPPGNLANAAVYVFERDVLDFIAEFPGPTIDLSTQVIPAFVGRIAVHENAVYHRDIGTPESLLAAQEVRPSLLPRLPERGRWHDEYDRILARELAPLLQGGSARSQR
ncbi:nucleotidyltransferase family protein, partial [bacterium]|nr:nucleotidyltransferase family protein [bacterium]